MIDDTPGETVPGNARPKAPGWLEILAGGAAYAASFLLVAVLLPLVENVAIQGVVGLFVSGAMGLIAFAVAAVVRIRGLAAFGVRRAKPHHILVAALLGLVAYLLGTVTAIVYMTVSGDVQNVQTSYQAAADAGWWSLALVFVAGATITPLGEEAFFRGVLANAVFARYRAWIAVLVSAAIFAVAHGINPVLPVAFVVGVLTALLFRWSGSIWPGVVLHGVNNATALLVPLLVAPAGV
ncbi:CPBP family intramembrane glutamic endopeptidase [Streptomonospora salina]|uniref:Membrane protease YdiL (CAAX protease family) n=1 Tax=Streptomonospora salina TaxID=104205 RepID=A0A841EBX7_9ACTN|nr:type II CAAX endopeptidase family protein [Streptomonospora salina]MBB5999924.1 membrane protease YdiL (CAAX protease family) [Streptomonospora salina]